MKTQAIINLCPNASFRVEDDIVEWLSDDITQPKDAEIEAEVKRLQAEYDANQYQRDRQYPSIGDQLDMQYHDQLDGTTTWKDSIAKVKADNPKPE
jgi:hypothetical protein